MFVQWHFSLMNSTRWQPNASGGEKTVLVSCPFEHPERKTKSSRFEGKSPRAGLLAEPAAQNRSRAAGHKNRESPRIARAVLSGLELSGWWAKPIAASHTSFYSAVTYRGWAQLRRIPQSSREKSPSARLQSSALTMLVLSLGLSPEERCGGAVPEKRARSRCILMARRNKLNAASGATLFCFTVQQQLPESTQVLYKTFFSPQTSLIAWRTVNAQDPC